MSSNPDYEFPSRPFSIDESVSLRKRVGSFDYTAPTVGLKSREAGQATNSKAVVGMYIGIANGGHYFGFNNETNEWESVSVFSYDGQPTPADLAAPLDDLMTWLTRIYPGEPLVTYGLNDPGMN
jgi:hypothetical protein